MRKFALCFLLFVTSAAAQSNPILDAIRNATRMRQEIEAARLMRQQQLSLEQDRDVAAAEKERIQAETDLLREQLRQMKEGAPPVKQKIDLEQQRRYIQEAVERLVVRHGDVEKYSDTITELNAYLLSRGQSPDAFYYDIYFQGLYLLARYFDENYSADSPQLVPTPDDRPVFQKN